MHPEFTRSNECLCPGNYLVPYTGTAKGDWFSYRNASAGYPRGTTPGLVHGSHCGTTLTPLASPACEDSKPTRFRPTSRMYDSRPRSGRCQRDDFSYDIRQPARHGLPIEHNGLSADAVEAADLVTLRQAHSAFDLDALASHAQAFLDTRARPTADIAYDPGGSQPTDADHRVMDTVGGTGRPGRSCSGRARPAVRAAKRRRRNHFSGNAPRASAGLWSRRGRGGNEGKGESESR